MLKVFAEGTAPAPGAAGPMEMIAGLLPMILMIVVFYFI